MNKSNKKGFLTFRNLVQIAIALLLLYIGIKFIFFVEYIKNPESALAVSRPPGVEAFLPISALVSLRAWIGLGIFDNIHPAGLVIFLLAIFTSLLLKRSFCSWVCPIGTLSEGLWLLGQKLFKRNFTIPIILDYPLRAIKYLLLAFFVFFIFLGMSPMAAFAFLQTPYNMVADVKMLQFFQNITWVGMTVLGVLAILSLLYKNFWCRYLCPYGALVGIFSIFSPWKITRSEDTCINCGKCSKACPNRIKVDESLRISSPECNGCLRCTEACPVPGTLNFELPKKIHRFTPYTLGVAVVGIWVITIIIAKVTGHWETAIPLEMYKELIPISGEFTHFNF